MQVRQLDIRQPSAISHHDTRKFIEFPFALYRDCEQWVPPLVSGVKKSMDCAHYPFYRHSDAAFFLAEEGDRVVGRVAVLDNRHYNNYHQCNSAFFHYFDTVNDVEIARALLDAAAAWATQRGLKTLIGPKGFLRSDGMGILVDGFDYSPAPGIPYNYAYYGQLLETLGFEKEIDYLSGYIDSHYKLPERFFQLAEQVKARRGFWIKSFTTKRELREWVPRIQEVNNAAFPEVWGYYPLDDGEVKLITEQLLVIADPRLIKLVMKGNELAGFCFVYPDITEGLKACRGRLWPWGWVALLRDFRRTHKLSANGLGLLPKYQGVGANLILYCELYQTVWSSKTYNFCDVAQVAENNLKSLGDMKAAQVQWYKRHRIYRREIK
ncbi:MAG: hypothetical protein JXA33_00545 [Anaerolineae bacterium]|nr:hypothetical protein [Anaerolineae bacterium]